MSASDSAAITSTIRWCGAPAAPCSITTGVVTWNEGLTVGEAYDPSLEPGTPAYLQQRRMESLVENLKMLKEQADAVDTTPVVMLHGAAGAPHQRIVDVMAALSEADIHSVGLSTTADE